MNNNHFNNYAPQNVSDKGKTQATLHSRFALVGEYPFHSSELAVPLPNLTSSNYMKLNIQSEGVAPMKFKILIACEESQEVCKAFRQLGHEAYSCDILPCSGGHPEWHIQGDVLEQLDRGWDLIIAHPPCTYLSTAGIRWFNIERYGDKARKRYRLRDGALEFFLKIYNSKCKFIAVENPRGFVSSMFRKPDQIIQPWQFGDSFNKPTCLWLKGLPKLKHTKIVDKGEMVTHITKNGKKKTDSKWYYEAFSLPPKERAKFRSKTFPGIAQAMAKQWSEYLEQLIATPSDSASQVSKADEHNISLQVTKIKYFLHPYFYYAIPSHIPNIKSNQAPFLQGGGN